MTHDLSRNEVLKLVVPQIKYFYGIETNRQLLERLGYTSPTYLSDTIKGKTAVSDKLISKLREVFLVNPDVFDGRSCDIFLPSAGFSVSIDPTIGEVAKDSKNVHVHIGDNRAELGGTAIEHQTKETTASLEKLTQMHEATVATLNRALEANQKTIEEMARQGEELQKSLFEEIRAQRELFYKMLNVIKGDASKSPDDR